jgi:hypothetical protein
MARPHNARGPAANNDGGAHRVYNKRISPALGIKLSHGQGQWVKAFLFLSNIDLKISSFKTVDKKNIHRSAAHI